jgi:hypothetical protein
MSDHIRQQLDEAWPGEWMHVDIAMRFDCPVWLRLEHDYEAIVYHSGVAWHGELRARGLPNSVTIEHSVVEHVYLKRTTRALRARAEILVDALERMEGLDE